MSIQRHFTGTEWEPKVGYCRAIKAGNMIYLSGTAPVGEDGNTHAPGDGYAQARRCFEIVESAIEVMGAGRQQVVRTRMYVTDISRWQEYGRAHQEFFGEHPPVTTMVEVKGLIRPDMLIEVEVEAFVG
ncbi:MAG: RidA family protein [Phormidesmis sp.]